MREKSPLWVRASLGTPIVGRQPPIRDARWAIHHYPRLTDVIKAIVYAHCVEPDSRVGEPWTVLGSCFSRKRMRRLGLLLPREGVLSPERLIVIDIDIQGSIPIEVSLGFKRELSLLAGGTSDPLSLALDLGYLEGGANSDRDEGNLG